MAEVISAGSLLIKSKLPDSVKPYYDPTKMMDKKAVSALMSNIIQHGGDNAHETIQDLSNLFFHKATEHGYTTPLSDYKNDSLDRTVMLDELGSKVRTIQHSKEPDKIKNDKIATISGEYSQRIWSSNLKHMVGKGSTAGLMAMTGARGNPMQLGQGTASPVMAQDVSGNPIPIVIKHSFGEGLTPAEHMAMSYGGRASTVKAQLSTSKPGALFKEITPNVFQEVVTQHDCGTKNGIFMPVKDKKAVINRVEVGTNTFIDDLKYKELVTSGIDSVRVRTPMSCEAKEGICQLCYGRDSYGSFPRIGENVGVIAAQSMSEVLTQAMLSTKHKGGVAGRNRDAYEEADSLLHMPENFPNKATISSRNGTVNKVETDALNVKHIFVDGTHHFVPSREDSVVKVGDVVRPGDRLSTGIINPAEIVQYKGLGAGRTYFSEALRDAYSLSNPDLDPRHFDLVSRNIMKYTKIVDPGHTGFLPNQIVEISKVQPLLAEDEVETPTFDSVGKVLSRAVLDILPGTHLDTNHISYLATHGIKTVFISKSGLRVDPIVKGVKTSKLNDPNWISRLALNNLKQSLTEAVSMGERAKIHGTDPIASYTLGHEFGEGVDGRY